MALPLTACRTFLHPQSTHLTAKNTMNTPQTTRRSTHSGTHISTHAATALLVLLLGSGTALAQHDHHHHGAAPAQAPAQATANPERPWAQAEIRRIDAAAGKISLKHGEIKNLDMPPMTMVFQLQDKALLGPLKAGDRVRFQADKVNGSYTVLAIEAQP